MQGLLQDIRDAGRRWGRTPLTAATALACLAVGIGANLALFALVAALYITPLPVPTPQRLARIVTARGEYVFQPIVWTYLRSHQPVFETVAAAARARVNLVRDGESRFVDALYVSGDFFGVVGVPVARGRGILPADETPGAPPIAVISHALWQRELGGREELIGSTLHVQRHPVTVIGVVEAAFFGIEVGRRIDVYLPLSAEPLLAGPESRAARPNAHWLHVLGRLAPDRTPAQATTALQAWQPALREATVPPGGDPQHHLAEPLRIVSAATGISFLRRDSGRPLAILSGIVAILLLVACANVAGMLVVRSLDRHRELAIRSALGASRWHLARGILVEALAVGFVGAALGATLGVWLSNTLVPWLGTSLDRGVAPHLPVRLDARLVVATAVLAAVASVLAALWPAACAFRLETSALLQAARHPRVGERGQTHLLYALVAVQLGLSLLLTSGAALLGRSLARLAAQPTAVDGHRVLLASVDGPLITGDAARAQARLDELLRQVSAIPDVEAAAVSTLTPLSGLIMLSPVFVPGFAATDPRDAHVAVNRVTPGFFDTFGTPLLTGRPFDERDGAGAPWVAIVNTAFVDRFLAGARDPIGRIVRLRDRDTTIVGVVATGRYMHVREPERPFVYVPLGQFLDAGPQPLRLAVRSPGPDRLRAAVVQAVRAVDRELSVEFRTLADEIATSTGRERLLAWLGGLLALLALGMAALGLSGSLSYLSYMVLRRRGEFAVRMAVGADRRAIVRLVLGDAALVVTAGAVFGGGAALASGRLLAAMLFEISPSDPATLAVAVVVVTSVAAASSWYPAAAAAGTDPAEHLRAQ